MSETQQVSLSAFRAGRTTETVTKTVICPLETSQRKNRRVRGVIDEWQAIAARMAELMPSIDESHWRTQDSTLYHVVRNEFPDHGLRAHDASQAAYKVGESFGSWHSNGHTKGRPHFGDGNYARFCHCGVAVEPNERGWGLKVGLRPRDPEWWHVKARPYLADHLEALVSSRNSTGSAELHLSPDGDLSCHLSVKQNVSVYEPADVPCTVGVDLGERAIYAAAVVGPDGVEDARVEPGREFRHHRERLKRKRTELMEKNDLRGVRACRDEHRRYTDHITHVVSREIVDLAVEHAPSVINLERLTGYRQSADDALHDWPFAELQTKIAYKATEEGIPVKFVKPRGTSYTCSECGAEVRESRQGVDFYCRRCDYQVHADLNAAKNIASR